MANWGEDKLLSEQIDTEKVKDIATKFFQYNYSASSIESATLHNGSWSVKVSVTLFGQRSTRILAIDSKTGKVISCE